MKPYSSTARYNTRKAWLALGRAREARAAAAMADKAWFQDCMTTYSRDMVRIARGYMKTAILYRQMNEVL